MIALALLLAGSARAISPGGITIEEPPKPQLLLFHGGSFLFEDPDFELATRQAAIEAGFRPHYVTYPLDDMPAAVLRARAEAKRLRDRFGIDRVYAYGFSAGGTLAALLAGEGLVAGAVAKAPPTDLINWTWPQTRYGLDYYNKIRLDTGARYRLSPLRRPQQKPLLLLQGRGDQVVPAKMNEQYAEKFDRVYLWLVAGGHTTERVRPWLIPRSMHWASRLYLRPIEAEARRLQEKAEREEEAAREREKEAAAR